MEILVQKHGERAYDPNRWKQRNSHLLEVYCSSNSQLTRQAQAQGLKASRFGLSQGDLSTFHGRTKLYDLLWIMKPQHLWLSPLCAPWSSWNRLNMAKSVKLEQSILADRQSENIHLLLRGALIRWQLRRGEATHFHLEQPQGSELVAQSEMHMMLQHTIRTLCDMCVAGGLRHPNSQEFLRKRTQALSTSQIMSRMLEQQQCLGNHMHQTIQGSRHPKGLWNMNVSKYTEMYTAMFGRKLARAIHCSLEVNELLCCPLNNSLPAGDCLRVRSSHDL